jgi:hypothetical protein
VLHYQYLFPIVKLFPLVSPVYRLLLPPRH